MKTQHRFLTGLIFIVALTVRLVSVFAWDNGLLPTGTYWINLQGIQANVTPSAFVDVTLGPDGLSSALFGVALMVLPNTPQMIYILQVVMDALICLLLVRMVFRLEGGLLAAGLAGVGFALYVPAILSVGEIGFTVFFRFSLVMSIYGFVYAFSADEKAYARLYTLIGMVGAVLVGFSAPVTRPLLWLLLIMPFIVMVLGRDDNVRYAIRWMIGYSIVVIGLVVAGCVLLATAPDALSQAVIGLDALSVLPNSPVAHSLVVVSASAESISSRVMSPFMPIFPLKLIVPIGLNGDVLPSVGMMFQAGVYGVLSILGMAWWAGQIGVRREALALVVMSGGAWLGLVFLITGDVPHLGAWMPFGMMAAGFALAGTFRAVDDLRGYLHPLEIILGVLALLVWLPVPFADWLSVPQDIALIWLCVRGVLALIIMWRMVRLWKEAAEVVRMWPPLLWVFGVIGVSTAILFV